MRKRIWLARTTLFGRVTDQAIYQALKRDEYFAANADERCHFPDCDNPLPFPRRRSRKFCVDSNRHRQQLLRHPELKVSDETVSSTPEVAERPSPEMDKDVPAELTEREKWILDVIDFRTQTGLRPDDVAPEFGIRLDEFQAATEKRDLIQAA